MKKLLFALAFLATFSYSSLVQGQNNIDYKSITGSWIGKIPAGGIELRVVFNLSLAGKDSLAATMDSPDQGVKGIKVGPVKFDGKDLNIKAPLLLGEYNGTQKNDTLVEGIWKQAGKTFDLNLSKLQGVFSLNRPQEPKPPFPYTAEDVTFKNEKFNINLAGTLTIPEGKGPFPAVILITGSGAQNRNEEILGHKPFWVIADYLTRNGIAVLRCDDRGVGKSQGSMLNGTTADFATDAEAAFFYLRKRPEIYPKLIGLCGHSEGGTIAPIIASSNPDIGFIISLAGMAVPGKKITDSQIINIGLATGGNITELKKSASSNEKLLAVLEKEPDNKKAEEKMSALYKEILIKQKTSPDDIEKALKALKTTTGPSTYNWIRYYLLTNPSDFWKKVKCPVLALNGDKDLQVNADENLPAIAKALRSGGNALCKTIKLPGLNHLFQHCKTGFPSEYGNIEETFSPEVLKIMSDWILLLQKK
jgi:uncharacterized protein